MPPVLLPMTTGLFIASACTPPTGARAAAGRVVPVAEGPAALARGLALRLSAHAPPDLIDRLALALARFKGPPSANRVPVYLVVADDRNRTAELKAADEWAVAPGAVAVPELEALLGPGAVKFMGGRRLVPAGGPPDDRPENSAGG